MNHCWLFKAISPSAHPCYSCKRIYYIHIYVYIHMYIHTYTFGFPTMLVCYIQIYCNAINIHRIWEFKNWDHLIFFVLKECVTIIKHGHSLSTSHKLHTQFCISRRTVLVEQFSWVVGLQSDVVYIFCRGVW